MGCGCKFKFNALHCKAPQQVYMRFLQEKEMDIEGCHECSHFVLVQVTVNEPTATSGDNA